ncbi:AAA family ATPase [Paenibacillus beijingensis]|uniref:Protein CR006 P-loop domain-containing protein n=1 Tax=Paenibacillus beijingensis TaxID=1126833 RepID=A0A0D5NIY5_9BACL|nr:hypothetical protein [Paenibacillus beijingensis]AJY75329.1 hypothetical protein VN24_13040 [Paenibacillus beijingensis]
MNTIFLDVERWLTQRPKWLQNAASRIVQKKLSEEDIKELINICKGESESDVSSYSVGVSPLGGLQSKSESNFLKLTSISDVNGINALNPKKPLQFNSNQLSIVFGHNGSGKSSYIKLLKHACGARESGKLLGNVFNDGQVEKQECVFVFNDGQEKQVKWSTEHGTIPQLSSIQLYDTACANVYVNEENEIAYEPWISSFFTELTEVCQVIGQALKEENDGIVIKPYNLPNEYQGTSVGKWLQKANYRTSSTEVDENSRWGIAEEESLNTYKLLLGEINPVDTAKKQMQLARNSNNLIAKLQTLIDTYNNENCNNYLDSKSEMVRKKKVAEQDAAKIFANSSFDGIGTESWKLLWQHARDFSEKHAYPLRAFPNLEDESKCVLCHQPLNESAKERLSAFESYVKGALMIDAQEAEERYLKHKARLIDIPTPESIVLHLNSIGLTDELDTTDFIEFINFLEKRKKDLEKVQSIEELNIVPQFAIFSSLAQIASTYEQQASSLMELAEQDNRKELSDKIKELEARKWVSQQRNLIFENIEKLKNKHKIEQAIRLTNTQAISTKKSELSNELITAEYIQRFNHELIQLGGNRIKVELVKSRVQRGHIYHKIQLRDCKFPVKTAEVLSEGEFRLVSLAGFLADVESNPNNTPFVFDDPISSLDQDFEEATVERLVKLSQKRQVIVFTHRISLLTLLSEKAKKKNINYDLTSLRSEFWGAGEPGELPIYANNTEKALNTLLNERLSKAKKILNEEGQEAYAPYMKGLCSDFRSLLERIIENDLMADVVHRFRRAINTMGKIYKLALIKYEDCQLFDELMTKYSRYEHSQSIEAPVQLPFPDELKNDMDIVKSWLEEFKNRK